MAPGNRDDEAMTQDAMIPLLPAATRTVRRGWPERRRPHKRPGVASSKPDNLMQAVYDRYGHVKKGHPIVNGHWAGALVSSAGPRLLVRLGGECRS
jgi:hypothetical protein